MEVLGVNSISKWCQILSGGRRYTCPTKLIDNQLFFRFKKQWHSVVKYATATTTELFEEGGKFFSRRYKQGKTIMKKKEINTFIEEMEAIGDKWTPEQVEDVYGDSSLEDALEDRRSSLDLFFEIVGKVINRD